MFRRHYIVSGRSGYLGVGQIQLVGQRLHPVVGQGNARGVEGVCLDDVRPGLEIGPVDGTDQLRPGNTQQIVMTLEITIPVGKALAAEISLLEGVLLNHSTHRAIENDDALGQKIGQGLMPVIGRIIAHKVAGYRSPPEVSTYISTYQDMLIHAYLLI